MSWGAPRASVAFLFIGGPHQVFHTAPVAAELSRDGDVRVDCLHADPDSGALIERVVDWTDADDLQVAPLDRPWLADALAGLSGRTSASKLPLLAANRRRLADYDAIVVPERTSAALKRMGVTRPRLIHFRHGAGDRAPASEARLNQFDLVVVPGEKDRRRALGHAVTPDRLAVGGYVKLDLMARAGAAPRPLFGNGRPTVLYNPHFDRGRGSWDGLGHAVISAFAAQDRYNLVIAPHIRLFEDAGDAERAAIEALAVPDRIRIDLGSEASVDMTYTLGADIYLGDMSSQVYEFLARPRPCAFLDAHGVAWRDDPRYACWHLGEVASAPGDILAAVGRAVAAQPLRLACQRLALLDAFGPATRGAARRSADIVRSAIGLDSPAAAPVRAAS
ncbi:MAG: hypothetical protein INF91_10180 [Alphaproteobacteria bacterium]|nr:hypothetical protein [Alphaproteobacteria bacterium]